MPVTAQLKAIIQVDDKIAFELMEEMSEVKKKDMSKLPQDTQGVLARANH